MTVAIIIMSHLTLKLGNKIHIPLGLDALLTAFLWLFGFGFKIIRCRTDNSLSDSLFIFGGSVLSPVIDFLLQLLMRFLVEFRRHL